MPVIILHILLQTRQKKADNVPVSGQAALMSQTCLVMQPDYGGMQQYVMWSNSSGTVQQFYTDTSIQVQRSRRNMISML